jgi:hypothetical protein
MYGISTAETEFYKIDFRSRLWKFVVMNLYIWLEKTLKSKVIVSNTQINLYLSRYMYLCICFCRNCVKNLRHKIYQRKFSAKKSV